MSRPPKILLVEDRDSVRATIGRILSPIGCTLIEASTGEDGLEKLKRADFDALILDIELPGMNGIEMLKEAKSTKRPLPPVVVLTIRDDYEHAFAAGKLRVFRFVSKTNLFSGTLKRAVISAIRHKKKEGVARRGNCFKHNPFGCNVSVNLEKNSVFVGIPFNMRKVYLDGIKPIIESFRMKSCRADGVRSTVDYTCKICAMIEACELAIFDISSLSSNVLIELGFAYAVGKNVILLKNRKAKIPTNLSGLAVVEYKDIASLRKVLRAYLKSYVHNRNAKRRRAGSVAASV